MAYASQPHPAAEYPPPLPRVTIRIRRPEWFRGVRGMGHSLSPCNQLCRPTFFTSLFPESVAEYDSFNGESISITTCSLSLG